MEAHKASVKERIVKAAQEEFLVSGYLNSSMRNIANQSGITVGNIYSYFSSKDDLFEYVISDALKELQKLFAMKVEESDELSTETVSTIASLISDVFLKYRIQFLILMDSSAGSKHDNIKNSLIQKTTDRILNDANIINMSKDREIDPFLIQTLSVALIEGLLHIFKHVGLNRKKLEALVSGYIAIIIRGLY